MPADDGSNIAIVSDLHLSMGYNPRTGAYERREDFFYDGVFAHFLDDLQARAAREGRKWRLVILGDVFDFLQVDLNLEGKVAAPLDRSTPTTLARMDVIARGHPEFFEALGRFVAAGFPLDVLPGNHDIEMIRPSSQEHFKRLLVQASGKEEAAAGVTFYPWIYYIPGVVYAEHGQQYDDENSFTTVMEPYPPDDAANREAIDQPLGSYFVEYLYNYIEPIDPFADNIKPSSRYILWALRAHPVLALSTMGEHFRLFTKVLGHTGELSAAQVDQRRQTYREQVLRPYAAELGLGYDTVVAIDKMAAVPAMSSKMGQLEVLVGNPLRHLAPTLAALVALFVSLRRTRGMKRSFLLFAVALAALARRERRDAHPATQRMGYLQRAAGQIHAQLQKEQKAVPLYVFGHTHKAEQFPVGGDDPAPHYINSGTWTPLVPDPYDLLATRDRFTLVQITRDTATGASVSRLMFWNDASGRPDMLPLMTG